MAAGSGGGAAKKRREEKDRERAMMMKRLGVERTTGRCPVCYQIITVDSAKSRYTHKCR